MSHKNVGRTEFSDDIIFCKTMEEADTLFQRFLVESKQGKGKRKRASYDEDLEQELDGSQEDEVFESESVVAVVGIVSSKP